MSLSKKIATLFALCAALTMDTVRGDPIICYESGHECTSFDQCCSQSCDSGTGTCLATAQLPAFDLDTADKEIVEPFVDLEPQMVQE